MHTASPTFRRRTALHFALLAALIASALTFQPTRASAHGTVVDPPTRNYGCATRWNGPGAPGMQEQDFMCYLAWHQSPDAMWNWNALYANNLGEDIERAIPDGQICSAGRAETGRYAPMDNPGTWKAARGVLRSEPVSPTFRTTVSYVQDPRIQHSEQTILY
jgi:chitin-binding protein